MFSWMEAHHDEYETELDLAADCCSVFGIWEDDYSVPEEILKMAISLKNPKKDCRNCKNCACKNKV